MHILIPGVTFQVWLRITVVLPAIFVTWFPSWPQAMGHYDWQHCQEHRKLWGIPQCKENNITRRKMISFAGGTKQNYLLWVYDFTGHLERERHSYMKEEFVPGPSGSKIQNIFRKWQKRIIAPVWHERVGVGGTRGGRWVWRPSPAILVSLDHILWWWGPHTVFSEQGVKWWIWALESKVWVLTIAWTSGLLLSRTSFYHHMCMLNADDVSL